MEITIRNYLILAHAYPEYVAVSLAKGIAEDLEDNQKKEPDYTKRADDLARDHNKCKCGGDLVVSEWRCSECNKFIGNP